MMNRIIHHIIRDHSETIHAGETFTGHVNLRVESGALCVQELVVQLIGISKSHLNLDLLSDHDATELAEPNTNKRLYLSSVHITNGDLIQGEHKLEFSLKAPERCPSSLNGSDRAFVRYYVYAHLTAENVDETKRKQIALLGVCPNLRDTAQERTQASGQCKLTAKLSKSLYAPGDNLHYALKFNSSRWNLRSVETRLVQHVLYTKLESDVLREETVKRTLAEEQFRAKKSHRNDVQLNGSISIPSDATHSFHEELEPPDIHPVQIKHFLEVEAMLLTGRKIRLEIPVLIGILEYYLPPAHEILEIPALIGVLEYYSPPAYERPPSYESLTRFSGSLSESRIVGKRLENSH